jgi:hypothetical protein
VRTPKSSWRRKQPRTRVQIRPSLLLLSLAKFVQALCFTPSTPVELPAAEPVSSSFFHHASQLFPLPSSASSPVFSFTYSSSLFFCVVELLLFHLVCLLGARASASVPFLLLPNARLTGSSSASRAAVRECPQTRLVVSTLKPRRFQPGCRWSSFSSILVLIDRTGTFFSLQFL